MVLCLSRIGGAALVAEENQLTRAEFAISLCFSFVASLCSGGSFRISIVRVPNDGISLDIGG